MSTSYTETYDINSDGIADLALPITLDQRLNEALDGDRGHEIADQVNEAINGKIREHGVNTETGEWYGDWSARDIVTGILDQHA